MDNLSCDALATLDRIDQPQPATGTALAVSPRKFDFSAEKVKFLKKDQLKMVKADPAIRSFSKEFAKSLAKSIESEGLLSPPIALNLGDGTYEVKAGRHRAYACFKILNWKEMPFIVMDDGPDELADAVDVASNLFTHALDEKQTRAAIKKWREIYLRAQPTTRSRGRERKHDGFAGEIEATLGVSKRQAQRLATTAANITVDDRQTLEGAGVAQSKIDEIAAIKDPEAIQAAVGLATSGIPAEEAVRRGKKVKSDKAEKAPTDTRKPEAAKEPQPKNATELTDEEWLTTHCKKLVEALPSKSAYKRDAIIYRRIVNSLIKFRTSTKKALAEGKKPGENGVFYASLCKVVRASHPMDWFICDGCNGKGHLPDANDKPCSKCLGGGYKLKFEDT